MVHFVVFQVEIFIKKLQLLFKFFLILRSFKTEEAAFIIT